jgi:hypothetical protein
MATANAAHRAACGVLLVFFVGEFGLHYYFLIISCRDLGSQRRISLYNLRAKSMDT